MHDKKVGKRTRAVLWHKDPKGIKFLIGLRQYDNANGKLNIFLLPGGGVDEGESLIAGCVREIHEEIGATIQHLEYIGMINSPWKPHPVLVEHYGTSWDTDIDELYVYKGFYNGKVTDKEPHKWGFYGFVTMVELEAMLVEQNKTTETILGGKVREILSMCEVLST